MGRYAFFSTGFEYKFAFGIQQSEDIELFGGEIQTIEKSYERKIVWKKDELPKIKLIMNYLLLINNLENFDVEMFEKSLNGTYILYNNFIDLITDEYGYKTLLCCIVYHQLLYNDELSCRYEL